MEMDGEEEDMDEEVDVIEEMEWRTDGDGSGGMSSSIRRKGGAPPAAEDWGEKMDEEEETEVEVKGALRSLVGTGTPIAFASAGC
jgi:hypothetical protein